MKKEDKRIRINKKLAAWSNGEETHIVPSYSSLADDVYARMTDRALAYYERLDEGYEMTGYADIVFCRELSMLYEEMSDRLWEQGRHWLAMRQLLNAANVLFDNDVEWYDFHSISYYSPQWERFREVIIRIRERIAQDPPLQTLYDNSDAAWWFQLMVRESPRIDHLFGIIL